LHVGNSRPKFLIGSAGIVVAANLPTSMAPAPVTAHFKPLEY
jgi:hypothetical protein